MKKFLLFFLFAFSFYSAICFSQSKVDYVIDGDTFCINHQKFRIYGIDADELSENYGIAAKKELEQLILYKTVTYKILYYDKYQRAVVKVYRNGKDIGLEMIKNGHAKVFRKYCSDQSYYTAEQKARINKLGLWQKEKNTRIRLTDK